MAIPEIAAISLDGKINSAVPGVPFIHRINSVPYYYVKVKLRRGGGRSQNQDLDYIALGSEAPQEPDTDELTNLRYLSNATDYYLEHFFPEYYPLIVDIDNVNYSEYRQYYEELREIVYNSISFVKKMPFAPLTRVYKLLLGTNLNRTDPHQLRDEYKNDCKLPSLEFALDYYNNERNAGPPGATSTFEFVNYPSEIDKLQGSISNFTTALSTLQGIVSPSVDANGLGLSTNRTINKILDVVYESIDFKHEESNFFDTDYVTMYFDDASSSRMRIVRIEYFILNVTMSEVRTASIGFITNSKYNPLFNDQLTLNTLKNYKELIQASERSSGLTQQFPMFGTQNPDSPGAFDLLGLGQTTPSSAPLIGDTPGSLTPGNNLFGNRASDDLIDVSNYDQLSNTFSTILTQEELKKELEEAESEEVKKNILQSEKAKKLNAGIQILDNIDNVLNFNIPLAGPNKTKKQRVANQILNQFGLQALAKEAVICLTLGLGATASRITQSVRNSIVQTASSLRAVPTLPSKEMGIERPSLGEMFKEQFKPFSVQGDPPIGKKIANIILGAVANAAFEIVKSLVELIQTNCNALLRGKGRIPIDVGEILRNENNKAGVNFPNLEELLEAEFAAEGLSLGQVYTYFSDVSEILDPIEVCRLLNSQSEVEQTTYNNILEYNQSYSLEQIRNNVNSISAVNGYFARMSQYVDTVSICNDIINERIVSVIESCNICLDEDFFESSPALEELIRITEEGIQIQPPPIEFLCPDSPNYLENPIAKTILPNLFDSVLDTTKTYMAGSLEAARTSLLEPTVVNEMNSDLSGSLEDLGIEAPSGEMNPEVLDFITDMFDFFDEINDTVVETIEGQACSDIDNAKIDAIMQNVSTIVDAINAGLQEVPGVIEEVSDKIASIKDNNSSTGPSHPHVEYVFPEGFRRRFENAIQAPNFVSSQAGVEGNLAPSGSIYASSYISAPLTNKQVDIKLLYRPSGSVQSFEIEYPKWAPNTESYLNFSFNLNDISDELVGTVENVVPVQYRQTPIDENYQDFRINPYVYRFMQPILIAQNNNLADTAAVDELIGEVYPSVYADLFAKMTRYVIKNGAFSVEKINNLKFFYNIDLCNPSDVGDLFDSAGILDQMKKEYAAAACFDNASAKDKARNTLYYGLMLMLIQAIIDEFIVKNIIVFTAFKMEDIFSLQGFRDIMIKDVVKSFQRIRSDGDSVLERELYNYFDRLSVRPSTINNGGIRHTYPPYEIPPGFEADPETGIANFPLGNDYEPLVRFLVEERLYYTWDDGQRTTLGAIGNIIDPENKNKSFDDIFLEDVIGVADFFHQPYSMAFEIFRYNFGIDPGSGGPDRARKIVIAYGNPSNAAVESEAIDNNPPENAIITLVEAASLSTWTPQRTIVELINIPVGEVSSVSELRNAIKQSEIYQIFKNQIFNQDAIMLGIVLENFYLTNRYFSDISDSFRGTKRAIINFMNMTDASSRPPVRDAFENSFIDSLANNGTQDFGSLSREIFLKFLKETPIAILKGLVELIDPHIAISKIIRDVTAEAFIQVSQAFQTSIDAQPDESPLKGAGITGEDLLALMFCLYNIGNETASQAALAGASDAAGGSDSPLFGPRITLDGVDFKGSVAGMFMAPPSPLGILYLLIELLKVKIDEDLSETENVDATEPADPDACSDTAVEDEEGDPGPPPPEGC